MRDTCFVLLPVCDCIRCAGSVAYVDTAQLDGESSLKPKHSADETQHMIRNASLRSVEGEQRIPGAARWLGESERVVAFPFG